MSAPKKDMKYFEQRLSGGHHNSLGNTVEVFEEVLKDKSLVQHIYNCYYSEDEVVRLRVSSVMKRLALEDKSLVLPYLDGLIKDISKIDQASTQWTLAILFKILANEISIEQKKSATAIMIENLKHHNDWIVINTTMEVLFIWAKKDNWILSFLEKELPKHAEDTRKSISNRAKKYIAALEKR
ncbi:MAG: hypothetical protein Kapaf2KO_07450 [Candidatus Kapaibacteriales bacterium]